MSSEGLPRACLPGLMAAASLVVLLAGSCTRGDNGRDPRISAVAFSQVTAMDVLMAPEVDEIVENAAEAIDSPDLAIAVVDRIGNILRIWNRDPASAEADCDNKRAVSVARAAAYLSHSQAPLTSRTGQFISTFHFPSTFGALFTDEFPAACGLVTSATTGVRRTPQGPLWQIDASNRGAPIESAHPTSMTSYDPGQSIPQLTNSDGTVPSPGLMPQPGGLPLYKRTMDSIMNGPAAGVGRRLVGAIGVWVEDTAGNPLPDVAEFAAIQGSRTVNPLTMERYAFGGGVPKEGAVFLVGVLLPFVNQVTRPPGVGPGSYDPANTVFPPAPTNGMPDPDGWLISPRDSASAVPFTANEVMTIVLACRDASLQTHAAIRLPSSSPCQMIITVTDADGVILGCFRMPDATLFSLEISITKARNSFYFSDPNAIDQVTGRHPLDGIVPPGTAVTCRTLGFLSQPFYPPTIETNPPGPLFDLVQTNRDPAFFDRMGNAPPTAGDTQSGIIWFPGSAPLYRDGVLIGGIGVSGDGVEQDDFVTAEGIRAAQRQLGFRLEPPPGIRCDNFEFRGVRLPYFKFPQNPRG